MRDHTRGSTRMIWGRFTRSTGAGPERPSPLQTTATPNGRNVFPLFLLHRRGSFVPLPRFTHLVLQLHHGRLFSITAKITTMFRGHGRRINSGHVAAKSSVGLH